MMKPLFFLFSDDKSVCCNDIIIVRHYEFLSSGILLFICNLPFCVFFSFFLILVFSLNSHSNVSVLIHSFCDCCCFLSFLSLAFVFNLVFLLSFQLSFGVSRFHVTCKPTPGMPDLFCNILFWKSLYLF